MFLSHLYLIFEKGMFNSIETFLIGLFDFLMFKVFISLYILDTNTLSDVAGKVYYFCSIT